MLLSEKLEQLEGLKKKFRPNLSETELNELKEQFNALEFSIIGLIPDMCHVYGILIECFDPEGKPVCTYEVYDERYANNAMEVISKASRIYYKDVAFWNTIAGYDCFDVVRIYLNLANIPIIKFHKASEIRRLAIKKD